MASGWRPSNRRDEVTSGDNSVFLDAATKTMIAGGDPKRLLKDCDDPRVRAFLTRGGRDRAA